MAHDSTHATPLEPPRDAALAPELLRQLPPLFQDLKPVSTAPEPLETTRQRFVSAPGLGTSALLLRPFYKPALPPLPTRESYMLDKQEES